MPDDLTRRDLIARTVPAVVLGSSVFALAESMAQNKTPEKNAADEPKSLVLKLLGEAKKGDAYALPPLPYEADALEPHIDAKTMTLHHGKHHATYVANLNKAIASLEKLRDAPEIDTATLAGLTRDVSFNAGGHIFHTIFWATLGKPAGAVPTDSKVYTDIAKQYGSFEKFQTHFSKVAAGVKGSGWAVAFYEPLADRILITDTGDQDNRIIPTGIPILLLDVWEHAYYLKYQNVRADYIKAWWNVVNWAEVDAFYTTMRHAHGA